MEVRVGFIFLLVLSAGLACAARQMAVTELPSRSTVISDMSALQIKNQGQEKEIQALDEVTRNKQVCKLCEEFATQALDYFADNKTQTEIIDMLHKTCSRVPSFTQECITLVDYYAPLFFTEISTVQPQDFCHKVNLCQEMVIFSSQLQKDSCAMCHRAVSEVLIKLKDPDTQLEIIELLLKACNSMENYAQKCKRMVFEYGPLFLSNAEQFLETTDICTMLHACDSPTAGAKQTVLKADS